MVEPYPHGVANHGNHAVRLQATSDPDIVIILGDAPGELSPGLVDAMVARLHDEPGLDAVGPLVPVIDAHKRVDDDATIVETLDRSKLAHLGRPAAVRRRALESGAIDRIGRW